MEVNDKVEWQSGGKVFRGTIIEDLDDAFCVRCTDGHYRIMEKEDERTAAESVKGDGAGDVQPEGKGDDKEIAVDSVGSQTGVIQGGAPGLEEG